MRLYGGVMLWRDAHPYQHTIASWTSGYRAYILVNETAIL